MEIQWLYTLIGGLSGILVGGCTVWFIYQPRLAQKENELRDKASQLAAMEEKSQQNVYWRNECEQLNQELRAQRDINSLQEAELREVSTRLEEHRLAAEEKQRLLINNEQRLNTQFENLANRIFEHTGRRSEELQRQNLTHLLNPFREQLESFKKQVQDNFGQETRERHTLTHEIQRLQQLNLQMAQEAVNLTNALKGDNKMQGNWGETILARILESSGLREGHEFETQVNLQSETQGRFQPDVIIHLPQKKDVIVDAKVSLIAYERYFNSKHEAEKAHALQEHINSIRNHIRGLSRKDYQALNGVQSLDYVLLFIPVEPAYLVALGSEPGLLEEALKFNIMLVSPSTLLIAVRTINNLWRYEYQSQNSRQIADKASKMYDKLRLFIDDMQGLGTNLDRAQHTYHQAMKKLTRGRGNLIQQAEGFKELGVEIKRPIADDIVERSQSDSYSSEP